MTADEALLFRTMTETDERRACTNCAATWEVCLAPPAPDWYPCCHSCDHP